MACNCRAVMSQGLVYWVVGMLDLVAALPPVVEAGSPAVWHFPENQARNCQVSLKHKTQTWPRSLLPRSAGKPSHQGQYTFKRRKTDSPPGERADSAKDKGHIATIFPVHFSSQLYQAAFLIHLPVTYRECPIYQAL